MIRAARTPDLPGIAAVHLSGFRAGNGPHIPTVRLADLSLERQQAAWEPLIGHPSPSTVVLVAEEAGRITGVAAAGPARDEDVEAGEGELYALYVEPARWGRGDAVALHAAALEHLRRQRLMTALAWALAENGRARRFYEREGWTPDGARRARFGAVAVRLRRKL